MSLQEILRLLEFQRRSLNASRGSQLDSEVKRKALRALAEQYFVMRHTLAILDESVLPTLAISDSAMRDLIALSYRRGKISRYKELLGTAKSNLAKVDGHLISAGTAIDSATKNETDDRIIETLKLLLPSAAMSYEQALRDLAQVERCSWRGPATDLRESLREVLDHLAPDEAIVKAAWFKQEKDTYGPTMRQKVRFVLGSRGAGKAQSAPAEDATVAVDEVLGRFVRSVYVRSSISTHTPTNKGEVLRLLSLVRVVLSELLEIR